MLRIPWLFNVKCGHCGSCVKAGICSSSSFPGFPNTCSCATMPTSKDVGLHAPTLIIWGEQDIALGLELLNGLEQWVDNVQIQRIPDSGPWVQQEQPDKVNQLMLDFLQTASS